MLETGVDKKCYEQREIDVRVTINTCWLDMLVIAIKWKY